MDIAAVLELGDRAYALAAVENDSTPAELFSLFRLEAVNAANDSVYAARGDAR